MKMPSKRTLMIAGGVAGLGLVGYVLYKRRQGAMVAAVVANQQAATVAAGSPYVLPAQTSQIGMLQASAVLAPVVTPPKPVVVTKQTAADRILGIK